MEGEKRKRQRYDRDFKMSAVKMVTEGWHKAAEVARSVGINKDRIYLWKKQWGIMGIKHFQAKAI